MTWQINERKKIKNRVIFEMRMVFLKPNIDKCMRDRYGLIVNVELFIPHSFFSYLPNLPSQK